MKQKRFYNLINEKRPEMSKSQHIIADYILENPHSIPFLTGAKLAELTGVSEATIVRFATFLGFKGYNEMQQQLAQTAERRLNTVERLAMSRSEYTETGKIGRASCRERV